MPDEATLTGDEFVGFDLGRFSDAAAAPLLSRRETIALDFRTNRKDGLLYHSGESEYGKTNNQC